MGDGSALLRTVYYTYWQSGGVSNITIADANAPLVRRDLALYYAKSGQLWMAVFAEWDLDETTFEYVEDSYEILSAREFRGGGRGRHLSREVDPSLNWHLPQNPSRVPRNCRMNRKSPAPPAPASARHSARQCPPMRFSMSRATESGL